MTTESPVANELQAAILAVARSEHAGIVIRAVAILDYDMERCLYAKMANNLDGPLKKRLFGTYGPLSTLAAKIDICFALSIFGPETYEELNKMRRIRNIFAHSKQKLSLDVAPALSLFQALKKPPDASGNELSLFTACIMKIDDELERFLVDHGVRDDIRPENRPSE